ncbi:MAG: bacillithiol biosynthesis cysteine-adding enzyme BshC [Bacteroidota bacterium]|nr:bacillithiol biosynthesis cysteine-adding enzyme BshC [Bacteroidota bacterium]
MQVIRYPLTQVQNLPPLLTAYLEQHEKLKSFFPFSPEPEGAAKAIEERKKFPIDHKCLAETIEQQYFALENDLLNGESYQAVKANIESLKDDQTFTVTTGHQLQIFTGPLFFIYKLISTINYAKQLKQLYPQYHFVPVYWMATEDHDLAEINHFHLWGKTFSWEMEAGGAVGPLSTDGLQGIMDELETSFRDNLNGKKLLEIFRKAYDGNRTLADATRVIVHALFGEEGLVILDPDDKQLKRAFLPIILEELTEQPIERLTGETLKQLSSFNPPVTPRPINLFYLEENSRKRIIRDGDNYSLAEGGKKWTRKEITLEANEYPERFSPNVLLRPLYQETILPNLAYIGGPNELAYWLELKSTFAHFNTFYPQLILRDSALWVGKKFAKTLTDLKLTPDTLFKSYTDLKAGYYDDNGLNHPAESTINSIQELYTRMREELQPLGSETTAPIVRESNEQLKALKKWRSAIRKQIESQQEKQLEKLEKLHSTLFPEKSSQERYDNFISLYLLYGQTFFTTLKENFDPVQREMKVFIEDR